MRRFSLILGGFLCAGAAGFASGIDATATYTDSQISPGEYQYDLTLTNTGATTIGTFWFSWIPGAGFMSVAPTDIDSPGGWKDAVTNGGGSIQWTTTSDLLTAGDSLSGFQFDSTLTPTQFQTDFAGPGLGAGDPITTAFVYIAAPLADPGMQIVATPLSVASTPEPAPTVSTILGFAVMLLFTVAVKRRRLPAA